MSSLFCKPLPPETPNEEEILRYNLSDTLYISLWRKGAEWYIIDNDGVVLSDYIFSWDHAVECWELCKPTH